MMQATDGWSTSVERIDVSLNDLPPEVISEAASYVIHLFRNQFDGIGMLDIEINISEFDVEKILVSAAKIRAVFEFETMVDFFGYKITPSQESDNKYELHPKSKDFEKALKLGYIQNEVQYALKYTSSEHWDKDGIKEFAEKLCSDSGKKLVYLETEPIERYVLAFPWAPPVEKLINSEMFFPMEAFMIEYSLHEWGIDADQLLSFEIADGVHLWDLIKVQRLIELFRWILVSRMRPLLPKEHEKVSQSLLPVFTRHTLRMMFDGAIGKNSQRLIDFLSYDSGKGGVLDLQYQPLIKMANEQYALPYNIMANSGILRNSIQLSKRRFYEDGTKDPLSALIDKVLSRNTSNVSSGVEYKWNGVQGEIDNIALIDNCLFIFECKNSSLPCSPHEAKTSYDYIVKAAEQLEKIKGFYQDRKFSQYLSKKLGWDIDNKKLVTCIIMSNRMFMGYRINGHVVRGSWETVNFIDTGIINMGGEQKKFWRDSKFCGADLYDFIEKDIMHTHLHNALIPSEIAYSFGKNTILQKSYYLDMKLVAENFGFVEAVKLIEKARNRATPKNC